MKLSSKTEGSVRKNGLLQPIAQRIVHHLNLSPVSSQGPVHKENFSDDVEVHKCSQKELTSLLYIQL